MPEITHNRAFPYENDELTSWSVPATKTIPATK